MVVVSHLSLFLGDKFRGRCDSRESHLPLFKTIYFPIAPFAFFQKILCDSLIFSEPFFLCDNGVISMYFDFVSDMQFAFFSQNVTVIYILYVRIDHFGNPSYFFFFAVDVYGFSGSTVLFGADVISASGTSKPTISFPDHSLLLSEEPLCQ